jgi:molybdopterin synthase catalytic subunit
MRNKIAPNDGAGDGATGVAAVYGESQNGAQDVFRAIGSIFDAVREGQISKREIERYHAMRNVAITRIMAEAQIKEKLIDKGFEERRKIIEKDFELIDAGMAQNDYTKINMGLQHITETIKQNPFAIFQVTTAEQRHNMLEAGDFSLE